MGQIYLDYNASTPVDRTWLTRCGRRSRTATAVAASTGSACHSGRVDLSPVLRAMGVSEHIGMGAIRFSLGRTTTADEITEVVDRVSDFLLRT
jgi:cysteine desulfurase